MATSILVGLCLLTLIGPATCENVTETSIDATSDAASVAANDLASVTVGADKVTKTAEETVTETPSLPVTWKPTSKETPFKMQSTTTPVETTTQDTKKTNQTMKQSASTKSVSLIVQASKRPEAPIKDPCNFDNWTTQCPDVKEPGVSMPATKENCLNSSQSLDCFQKLISKCDLGGESYELMIIQLELLANLSAECKKKNTKDPFKSSATTVNWSAPAMIVATLLLCVMVDVPFSAAGGLDSEKLGSWRRLRSGR